MSILVGPETRLVVQGLTGREGGFHAAQMVAYGTKIVAGVTPGRGGERALDLLEERGEGGAALDDGVAGDLLAGPSMRQCTHVRSPDGVCL